MGGGAFPVCPFRSFLQKEPQRAIARTAPHDRQNNSARPSARHIAAQSPVSHTPRHAAPPAAPRKTLGPAAMPGAPPRPATKIVLLVAHRTPRTIALSAAPQKTLGPAAMPGAPPRPAAKIVLLVARRRAAPPSPRRPAAPKFGSTARPRHAAGRPRAAKARAVWQPRRAPPRHENSPVSRTPRAAPRRPACRAAKNAWASRHAVRTAPPRRENSPVSRTPHAAPPSPRPSHFRAQSGQPRKNWTAPDRTHRPSPAVKTIRQQRPRPKARAPRPYGQGARFPFVRFVPSSSMSRSAQSQEPRRTIAKTTARGRPPVTSLRKVLSATRRAMPPRLPRRKKRLGQPPCRAHRPSPAAKTIRQQRTPVPKRAPPARTGEGRVSRLSVSFLPLKMAAARVRKNRRALVRVRPRRFSPPRPRPRWAPDAARPPRPPRACPRPRASGARPACSAR